MREGRRRDEIIEEVRRVREELGARYGYDVDRLYEAAKRREGGEGRQVLAPRGKSEGSRGRTRG